MIAKKWRDFRYPGTVEIAVAKGWCIPARGVMLTALEPYGIVIHDIGEDIIPDPATPSYIDAWVRVNPAAASWVEYLLLCTGQFQLLTQPQNRRNAEWAARHEGQMPTPWGMAKGERWVEAGCKATGEAMPVLQEGVATSPPPVTKRAKVKALEHRREGRQTRERRPRR